MGRYFYELRTYTRQYQNLQENKTAINNQIHALELTMYQSKKVLRQLRKVIKLFDEQFKELTKLIAKHITNNNDVSQKVKNICKLKGLATLTVATILAETNGFELFENYKQLVFFLGYDVVEKQSGTRQGKNIQTRKFKNKACFIYASLFSRNLEAKTIY